jgi:hypothetical protein
MTLSEILLKINFVKRYEKLCSDHLDFDNRMVSVNKKIFDDILQKLGYNAKYIASENFYKISAEVNSFHVNFHLVLKGGLVEAILYIEKDGNEILPNGRLDFIPEEMNIPFDRDKYNLPIYASENELEIILEGLYNIYSDLKTELSLL